MTWRFSRGARHPSTRIGCLALFSCPESHEVVPERAAVGHRGYLVSRRPHGVMQLLVPTRGRLKTGARMSFARGGNAGYDTCSTGSGYPFVHYPSGLYFKVGDPFHPGLFLALRRARLPYPERRVFPVPAAPQCSSSYPRGGDRNPVREARGCPFCAGWECRV
jgi:hypothetical protein